MSCGMLPSLILAMGLSSCATLAPTPVPVPVKIVLQCVDEEDVNFPMNIQEAASMYNEDRTILYQYQICYEV